MHSCRNGTSLIALRLFNHPQCKMSRQLNKRIKCCEAVSKTVDEKRRRTCTKQDNYSIPNSASEESNSVSKTEELMENLVVSSTKDLLEEQLLVILQSVKSINSHESKFQFLHSLFKYLTTCPVKEFFNELIKTEIEGSSRFSENLIRGTFKVVEQSIQEFKSKVINRAPKEFNRPVTYFDFTMCEDEQFQELMHVSRKTVKIIIDHARHIPVDLNLETSVAGSVQKYNPVDKMIFLVIWYLRSKECNLEDAVILFELGTVENAKKLLNRGISLLLHLKANSGLLWPSDDEFLVSASLIERRFSFPNVAGVMGHRVLKSVHGHQLMIQAVCNEKSMFTDVFISFDTRRKVVFKQSMLKPKMKELKNGLSFIVEDFGVPMKSSRTILFPEKENPNDFDAEIKIFNCMHDFVLVLLKNAFNMLFKRFQRLELLEECEPDIVVVGCVLHNYCIKLNDVTHL